MARKVVVEFGNSKLEIAPEHLQEGGVEADLVFVEGEPEARADALALELHRDEDERRAIGADAVLRLPFEKAETQEKHVGAAFFEGETCGAEEIGEAGVGVFLWGLRIELVSGQSL